jgi:hypothetical protein
MLNITFALTLSTKPSAWLTWIRTGSLDPQKSIWELISSGDDVIEFGNMSVKPGLTFWGESSS